MGILLFNKFFRPVVIQTTITQSSTANLVTTSTYMPGNLPFPYSTCPSDRWGSSCQNICKPCGLGVCHSVTGKCICPVDIYGEFCDLWKGEKRIISFRKKKIYLFFSSSKLMINRNEAI